MTTRKEMQEQKAFEKSIATDAEAKHTFVKVHEKAGFGREEAMQILLGVMSQPVQPRQQMPRQPTPQEIAAMKARQAQMQKEADEKKVEENGKPDKTE